MLEKTPILLAYLAGVLDSDGSICIVRQAPNVKYPDSFTFTELAMAGQTSQEAVKLFAELWPGEFILRKARKKTWRRMYVWRASSTMAAKCISELKPYLRVKARQADLLLALRSSKDRPRSEVRTTRVGIRGVRLNPEIVAERFALWRECRALNDNRRRKYH